MFGIIYSYRICLIYDWQVWGAVYEICKIGRLQVAKICLFGLCLKNWMCENLILDPEGLRLMALPAMKK